MQHTKKNIPFIKPSIDERHICTDLEINNVYINQKYFIYYSKVRFQYRYGFKFFIPFSKKNDERKEKGLKTFYRIKNFILFLN